MPSPTSSTRPTSRASSRSPPTLLISCSRTETISSALNLMTASLNQLVPNRLQPAAYGPIVQPVADADHQAAQQIGIDAGFQHGFAVVQRTQLVPQAVLLVFRQRHGRLNEHAHPAR